MSLFDYIEKLINEHGSSAILKERLEFLKDQISALEKDNDALKSENAILKNKENTIQSQLNKAIEEIERLNQIIKGLEKDDTETHFNEVTEKVLKLFFEAGHGLSVNQVATALSMDVSTAQYHFDLLLDGDLIEQTRVGFVSFRSRESAALYELTSSGRKYVVENIVE